MQTFREKQYIHIYIYIYISIRGYIHELFVGKPERARYERHSQEKFGGAAAKKAAKSEKLFECKRCTILIDSQRPLHR